MPTKFRVLTLNFKELEKNEEPQSRKPPRRNVFVYTKDTIMATVEWCEKNFPEQFKFFDQEKAMKWADKNFQRVQYELEKKG